MPVLRNVETMNFADIERELNVLAQKVSSDQTSSCHILHV